MPFRCKYWFPVYKKDYREDWGLRSIRIEGYWEIFYSATRQIRKLKINISPGPSSVVIAKLWKWMWKVLYLDSIPSFRRDPFHRQHNLELHLAGEVPGWDLPERRVLIYFVRDNDRPKHLEKILSSIDFSSEIHALKVVGNDLKYKYLKILLFLSIENTSPSSVTSFFTIKPETWDSSRWVCLEKVHYLAGILVFTIKADGAMWEITGAREGNFSFPFNFRIKLLLEMISLINLVTGHWGVGSGGGE